MEEVNNKFVYNEGDIEIKNSQCGFCKYNNEDNEDVCIMFKEGKPLEVKETKKKCEYLDLNSILEG